SRSDSATGGYCIIALYAATASAGAPQKDFTNEWKELAVAPYNAEANPNTETQTTADGWKAVAGAATANLDGIDSYVILTVYSGFGKTSSVMANLNDQSYIPELEKFLENIRLDKKAKIAVKPVSASPANNSGNSQVVGQWTKSSGSPPQYNNGVLVNLVHFGHYTGQYSFNADGTYLFHGEAKTNSDNYRLIDEAGKFTVSGDQLILVPSKGSHRQVKGNGALVKTDKLALTKRVYKWKLHYYEGIQEYNLVLTATTDNLVDGGFSDSPGFLNSFLYAKRNYKTDWKFNF
ncbi:MAG: hypothetical protein H7Y01_10885, partial [Ferruginibacter sp.]|nr:hypothetical protein [Chitinophagaceae bacterium]